ncbi:hypothetical protein BB560_004208 [Smittium megazygosporum]|uniref:NOT2/NOT3/NOT5 C-terminal domain-containing protein n=1 Tax=Smittium megazygosporum TaxID=133381 RepID=A0A2T9Z9W5_9FUNG|nr:hypothetical protein BB560_004208 [Smittium megazygosporum]
MSNNYRATVDSYDSPFLASRQNSKVDFTSLSSNAQGFQDSKPEPKNKIPQNLLRNPFQKAQSFNLGSSIEPVQENSTISNQAQGLPGLKINLDTESKNTKNNIPLDENIIKSNNIDFNDNLKNNSDPNSFSKSGEDEQLHIAQISKPFARFGILGLLSTNDSGFDISKFGLPLNSTGKLFPLFSSPWSDVHPLSPLPESELSLPSSYNALQLQPPNFRISLFPEETIFYIFYSMPKTELQLNASEELYRRQWRFHKELKLWITKDAESQPATRTPNGEQGVFVVFDPTIWQKIKKEILILYESLEENLNLSQYFRDDRLNQSNQMLTQPGPEFNDAINMVSGYVSQAPDQLSLKNAT